MSEIRNVRPSWARVSLDDSGNRPNPVRVTENGRGPRLRSGTLSVDFLARIDGEALPFLTVQAIGSADKKSVLWRIVDNRTGAVLFEEKVNQ